MMMSELCRMEQALKSRRETLDKQYTNKQAVAKYLYKRLLAAEDRLQSEPDNSFLSRLVDTLDDEHGEQADAIDKLLIEQHYIDEALTALNTLEATLYLIDIEC